MKKFLKSNYWLLMILILAFVLRFYRLGDIPISLNHDETALGYNAYSFLTTGADEYGNFFPLSLKSFGDWKLPLYPWLDTIPILLLGTTEVAVRLPSFVAGIISILLTYFLALRIFKNKKSAMFSAFLFSISPWGIFFSRIAYEANVATALFLGGLLCFVEFYYYKKRRFLIASSILWGMTIFTYHAFVLFAPLYFAGILTSALFLKKFSRQWIPAILIIMVFVTFSAYSTLTAGSIGKLSSTSLFDDQELLNERVNIYRGDVSGEIDIVSQGLHNKYTAVLYQVGQNYLASFSPDFLFNKGGEKFLHNIGNFGNFYLIDIVLIISGIFALIYKRQERLMPLIVWLIVGPIPSAITTDSPSSTRLFLLLPLFILVMGYGASFLWDILIKAKLVGRLAIFAFCFAYVISFTYFIDAYFVHMNYHKAQFFHYGYKEAVELSNKYKDHKVVMFGPENFPYISFLFYNRINPKEFQQSATFYPDDFGPFFYVKSFGRYSFVDDIDYENLQPNILYIDYRGIRDEDYKILDPSGIPVFKYFFKDNP